MGGHNAHLCEAEDATCMALGAADAVATGCVDLERGEAAIVAAAGDADVMISEGVVCSVPVLPKRLCVREP